MARLMNDEGAVHMLEAILAAVLLLSTLAFMNASIHVPASGGYDSLSPLTEDILNVVAYRDNTVADPSLSHVMSSPDEWMVDATVLGECIESMLPAGDHYYLRSPYGDLGNRPPDHADVYALPFMVYCEGEDKMEECELIIWR